MPAFWEAVGDLSGLTILDLGCGSGALGGEVLDRGAARYMGVDASGYMIDAARARLDPSRARVEKADLTEYLPELEAFD